jgi:predicted nucleotidyltransferase
MLTDAEIDAAVQEVVLHLRPQRVIVFGSYAKGTATARSDLDLLAIVETTLPAEFRTTNIRPYLPDSLVPLDLIVHTPEEVAELSRDRFSLVSSAVRTGRVVFEAA